MPHISEYYLCPVFHPLSPCSFFLPFLPIHHSFTGWWALFAPSTSHCWQQQDSSERKESLPLMLLRFAWKGAAGRMETHFCTRRLHRGGLLCKEERPHDRATVPGESLAKCLAVRQSAHHPARRYPGRGLLHLPVQHTPWRAEELHSLPRHLW